MKKLTISIALLVAVYFHNYAQQAFTASGGNASGLSGSSNFSIGQVFINFQSSSGNTISEGIQIPYEIYVLTSSETLNNVKLSCAVYPNPTTDKLILRIDDANISNYSISLYDQKGTLMEHITAKDIETSIDFQKYPNAAYILKITYKNQIVKNFKIIKK